eukprot:360736-Chlamydomonas_euryale.AAC.3
MSLHALVSDERVCMLRVVCLGLTYRRFIRMVACLVFACFEFACRVCFAFTCTTAPALVSCARVGNSAPPSGAHTDGSAHIDKSAHR